MMIVGGRVTRMEAKRIEENSVEGVSININVKSAESEKKIIKIIYSGIVDYAPKVAEVVVEGELFVEEDSEKLAKEAIELYKKNKQLPDKITEESLTAINYTITAVGTLLAFGIGLSAPINIPRAKIVRSEAGQQKPQAQAS